MFPILVTVGPLPISSFGFFLALGLIASIFTIWRLVRVYDLDEEKALDLILLTFFGGLIGARILFVILNWQVFGDFVRIVLINRYPGLSFWGGVIGGTLALWFFSKRSKFNFWQIADFGVVGLSLGLVLGNIGCFLGGCAYGMVSDSPLAFPVVGLIGKRLPVTLFEALAYLILFLLLWRQVVRFHFFGKIVTEFLLLLGIIKFVTENYRGDNFLVLPSFGVSLGQIFSGVLIILSVIVFYKRSKRTIMGDLGSIGRIFTSGKARKQLIYLIRRSCYNQFVSWKVFVMRVTDLSNFSAKNVKRKLNVRTTPKDIR